MHSNSTHWVHQPQRLLHHQAQAYPTACAGRCRVYAVASALLLLLLLPHTWVTCRAQLLPLLLAVSTMRLLAGPLAGACCRIAQLLGIQQPMLQVCSQLQKVRELGWLSPLLFPPYLLVLQQRLYTPCERQLYASLLSRSRSSSTCLWLAVALVQ